MSEHVGFTSMAGPHATGDAPSIGIGMLGYAFMGKAHSNAFKTLPYMMYPPVAIPRLVSIAGRNSEAVREAARRYGYEKYTTDWRDLVSDQDIQVFDNGGPNDAHAEP
ncbi:MAG: gfo/Idh/MocA family oxidoreductase, partial [Chloroflexi bacterium]|nr:gfo/Idh/MocA family oxidoreductase [Chloroflexota bacterium]